MTTKALTRDRRCQVMAPKAGGAGASAGDVVISAPVGTGGTTRGPNVVAVQNALNDIPAELGAPDFMLATDGIAGSITIGAIKNFQQFHFGFHDGRVDVLGRTHAKLSSLQSPKRTRMQTAKTYLERALNAMRGAQTKVMLAGTELALGGGLMGQKNLELANAHFDVLKSPNPAAALAYIGSVYTAML